MKHIHTLIIYLVVITAVLFSCRTDTRTEQEIAREKIDSLQMVYNALNDSLSHVWQMVEIEEGNRMNYLQQLLDTLDNHELIGEEEYQSYQRMLDALTSMSISVENLDDSSRMRAYDSASRRSVARLVQLARQQTGFGEEIGTFTQQMLIEMEEAEKSLRLYKNRYDILVNSLNQFIEENEHLVDRDNTKVRFKKKPLLQYPNDLGDPYDLSDTLNATEETSY